MLRAIRLVAAGESLLSPSVTRRVIESFTSRSALRRPHPRLAELTEREREVLGPDRRGAEQRRDRRPAGGQPGHRPDPRQPGHGQARRPGPRAAGGDRLPVRPGPLSPSPSSVPLSTLLKAGHGRPVLRPRAGPTQNFGRFPVVCDRFPKGKRRRGGAGRLRPAGAAAGLGAPPGSGPRPGRRSGRAARRRTPGPPGRRGRAPRPSFAVISPISPSRVPAHSSGTESGPNEGGPADSIRSPAKTTSASGTTTTRSPSV